MDAVEIYSNPFYDIVIIHAINPGIEGIVLRQNAIPRAQMVPIDPHPANRTLNINFTLHCPNGIPLLSTIQMSPQKATSRSIRGYRGRVCSI